MQLSERNWHGDRDPEVSCQQASRRLPILALYFHAPLRYHL